MDAYGFYQQEVECAWVALVLFVVVLVLNEYFGPKPNLEDAKPGGLGDFNFPTATEGRTVSLLWGKNLIKGANTIWYGDIQAAPIRQRVQTGLWSSKKFTRGFFYILGAQMALCRGDDDGGVILIRAWAGDKLAYDSGDISGGGSFSINDPNFFGGNDLGTGGIEATVEFFGGSTTQAVSSYLNATDKQIISGTTTTAPRYTGTSYVVLRGLDSGGRLSNSTSGAYLGISTQVKPWSFEVGRFPAIFDGQSAGEHKVGTDDCNPINVLYEILTNKEWGLGFLPGDIDTGTGSTFVAAADEMITEANGFSMLLDRSTQAVELVRLIEEQIDGLVYMNPTNGKWSIALARSTTPWTPASPRTVDESNAKFTEFIRGSWEDTTNEIQVKYWNRADDYKESHVVAHDMANIQIQGAGSVLTGKVRTGKIVMPGVRSGALATNLCWRHLRVQSYPVARVIFQLDRSFWDVKPGEVVNWSNSTLGITDLPMRISSVNFGKIDEGIIECPAVQDVFKFASPSYGAPGSTNWSEPTLTVVAFPTDQQLAFEAPLGIVTRDPNYTAGTSWLTSGASGGITKVFCAARQQGVEGYFEIRQRNAAGVPSGTFGFAGDVAAFTYIGELTSALGDGTAYPTAAIEITPSPDTQGAILGNFTDTVTITDMGQSLVYLCMVGTEFMIVTSAAANGANVDFEDVYRGVLDSVQQNHPAGTKVWMLSGSGDVGAGAGISDTTFTDGNQVDIKLIPVSAAGSLSEASANTINFTLSKRALRPYPPSAVRYNGSGTSFNTPSLEGAGSGLNGFRIDVDWLRRRYDTADEVAELDVDNAPDASTEFEVELRIDPEGSNTLVGTKAWTTGTGTENFTRLDIIENATGNAVGEVLEIRIKARHDVASETNLESLQTFTHRFTPTTSLTGQFAMGAKTWSNETEDYVAAATGTYTINIGAAFSTGNVQYRINGGAWTTSFAAGLTTGTIPGVTATDTIELRHDADDGAQQNFVELQNPSATAVAYGLFLS